LGSKLLFAARCTKVSHAGQTRPSTVCCEWLLFSWRKRNAEQQGGESAIDEFARRLKRCCQSGPLLFVFHMEMSACQVFM